MSIYSFAPLLARRYYRLAMKITLGVLKIFRSKFLVEIYMVAGQHKNSITCVVNCFGILRCFRNMRLNNFQDKEAIFREQFSILNFAFKISIALFYQRSLYVLRRGRDK